MTAPDAAKALITKLMKASDTGPSDSLTSHEAYADLFTPDAEVIMGQSTSQGRAAIIAHRQAAWVTVGSRYHVCEGVFVGTRENEYMAYGSVEYGYKDGNTALGHWAIRLVLAQVDGELRIAYYRVWLVSSLREVC